MHKFLSIAAMLLLLAAGACNRDPKSLADLKDASPADSMMFYFGEMQAATYFQDAETDTLLSTEKSRNEFIRGFREAMNLDHADDAYNKGLQLGLRLALRLREFENRYGVKFSKNILAASLANSLKVDTVDLAEAQKGFYLIKDRLELATANSEIEEAKSVLKKKAEEMGFTMVNDTLYAKDVTAATPGPRFKDGDHVAIQISTATLDGKEIVARQFPDSITIGAGRVPRVVCLGTHTMTSGQTRTFMTTPRTLFGKRYASYRLPSDQPVLFTVKVTQN